MVDDSNSLNLEGPAIQRVPSQLFIIAGTIVALIIALAAFVFTQSTSFLPIPTSNPVSVPSISPSTGESPAVSPNSILGATAITCQDKTDDELQACCTQWMEAENIVIPSCEGHWEALEIGCGWDCAIE